VDPEIFIADMDSPSHFHEQTHETESHHTHNDVELRHHVHEPSTEPHVHTEEHVGEFHTQEHVGEFHTQEHVEEFHTTHEITENHSEHVEIHTELHHHVTVSDEDGDGGFQTVREATTMTVVENRKHSNVDESTMSETGQKQLVDMYHGKNPELVAELRRLDKGVQSLPDLKEEQKLIWKQKEEEAQRQIETVHREYTWEKFIDDVPRTAADGAPIPDWQRRLQAKKIAVDRAHTEEERILTSLEEERLSRQPVWK